MKNSFFDKAVILLAVIIIFYVSIFLLSDLSSIAEQNINFNIQYLPIIILLMITHTIVSSFKFHRLLSQLKKPVPFTKSISIFLGGLTLALTPGGIGTTIKSLILKKQFGYSISSTFPIIIIERWTELISIIIIIGILLIWSNFLESQIILVFGTLFVIVFLILISKSNIFISIKKIILKIKYLKKFHNSIDESKESFRVLLERKNILEIILISIFTKVIHLFTIYLVFISIGMNIEFFDAGQIYYTSLLIGTLSFLPAGVVVTESGMITMLINHGINFSIATLGVISIRFFSTWSLTIAGVLTYYFKFRNNGN